MDSQLLKLKQILTKTHSSRDSSDIKIIASHISNIKFFENLKEFKSVFKETCAYLSYEYFRKSEFVFKEGEYGDKFYILLKGEAGVIVTVKDREFFMQREVLVYKDGSSFGEISLIEQKPRSASILTKTECHFAVLDKSNYNRILASLLKQQKNALIEFLQTQVLFKSWTKGSILKITYCFEEKVFKKDQIIFKEGQSLDHLYIIREGEVKLSRNLKISIIDSTEPLTRGTLCLKKFYKHRADISMLGTGDILGLNDIDLKVYSSSCTCITPSARLLMISLQDFKKRLKDDESLELINTQKTLRNSVHEVSVKSITKVIKDRIVSPYKKILMSEVANYRSASVPQRTKLEKKQKKQLLIKKVSKKHEKSLEEESPRITQLTFDSSIQRNCENFLTQDSALNAQRAKALASKSRTKRPMSCSTYHETRSNCNSRAKTNSNYSEIPNKKHDFLDKTFLHSLKFSERATERERTFNIIISSKLPFGRIKTKNQNLKEEETVNIHSVFKTKNFRNRNPTNWSFRNIVLSPKKAIIFSEFGEKVI